MASTTSYRLSEVSCRTACSYVALIIRHKITKLLGSRKLRLKEMAANCYITDLQEWPIFLRYASRSPKTTQTGTPLIRPFCSLCQEGTPLPQYPISICIYDNNQPYTAEYKGIWFVLFVFLNLNRRWLPAFMLGDKPVSKFLSTHEYCVLYIGLLI